MRREEKYDRFAGLHVPGDPVALFNIWDVGSAKAVEAAGAKALATASWAVAAAHGFADGEAIPLALAIANAERIIAATDLPVTVDLEAGYGDIEAAVRAAIGAGAVGCNFEDGVPEARGVQPLAEQATRIRAARAAAGAKFFLNARIDLFLQSDAAQHAVLMDEALERAAAYSEAGAGGIFIPGLKDPALIRHFCSECSKPVNVMAAPSSRREELGALGVARISYGPGPYRMAMEALGEAARAALV